MPILPGRRLGPYEILSSVGAGGMGEVYKARDTRLDRIVAVKVLPTHLADRSELRERFEREARTVASLNHPHICTLFDIGQQDGIDYLVMEYLEGETLAQRLVKGSLPLEQVLQFAIEIADALDKAHRKGVTHRDLKPGNIMLTKTGTKLLDFGLAKLKQEASPANVQLSQLPTANDPLTAKGTIVGTLQYMAPEQLEGKEVDARTDIFAFGAVVYEMATGKKCFEGKSHASLISAIMSSDPPPMSSLQPMTPPAVGRVVKKCLAKEPEKRWQGASDLCDELKWIAEGGGQAAKVTALEAQPHRKRWRSWLPWAASLILAATIAAIAIWSRQPVQQPVTRFAITLPPSQRLAALDQPAIAISPDGKNTVYVAVQAGNQQLFLRPLDSQEAKPIVGTEGAIDPFFSPDGQWIGFFAGGKLKKVSLSGGAAIPLTSVSTPGGASWSSQGTIALQATIGASVGLQQVSQEGGTPRPLTKVGRGGEPNHGWPEFLPGGKALFFARSPVYGAWGNAQIAVQIAGTGEPRDLVAGSEPRYAATGHLLVARVGTLMAAPFDARSLELTGVAVPALEGVMQSNFTGAAQYSVSSTGTLVYIPGGLAASESRLVWVSRNGEEQLLPVAPHNYQFPRVSPDGGRVAVAIAEQEQQIWVYDLSRDTLTRLTFDGITNNTPAWSSDGKRIAFNSDRATGPLNLYWRASDGSGDAERLTTSDYLNAPGSFSPDGQLLAFQDNNPETGRDIWVLRLSDRKAQPFLRTPYEDTAPKFSPDGKWLAYSSNESGRREIYVKPYAGPGGGKWQISTDGGQEPVWNPKGHELFYRNGGKIMTVEVVTKSGFSVGKPRMLFEGPYLPTSASFPFYDVSPDGQRFLMLKPSEQAQAAPTQINVVLNWFEELKQKVPTGKK
jgi:eukaryotic-like serine/threonine-protein kinase